MPRWSRAPARRLSRALWRRCEQWWEKSPPLPELAEFYHERVRRFLLRDLAEYRPCRAVPRRSWKKRGSGKSIPWQRYRTGCSSRSDDLAPVSGAWKDRAIRVGARRRVMSEKPTYLDMPNDLHGGAAATVSPPADVTPTLTLRGARKIKLRSGTRWRPRSASTISASRRAMTVERRVSSQVRDRDVGHVRPREDGHARLQLQRAAEAVRRGRPVADLFRDVDDIQTGEPSVVTSPKNAIPGVCSGRATASCVGE
jgi:hypothetical protein